jgi:hypothetical protein
MRREERALFVGEAVDRVVHLGAAPP